MTGFGGANATFGKARLVVDVRTVNHRYFETRIRAAGVLSDLSGLVEETLRKRLHRGRADVSLRLERSSGSSFDRERIVAMARELGTIRDEVAPGEPLPFDLLSSVLAGATDSGIDLDDLRDAVERATREAADEVDRLRLREGDALRTELLRWVDASRADLDAIEELVPIVVLRHHTRLTERVAALIGGDSPKVDPDRIAQEIAILADRADVTEELARARSHLSLFRSLLDTDEPVGRKLDFVTQELMREANTIGSKNADSTIAHRVIDLKADIERLREQVQNVL